MSIINGRNINFALYGGSAGVPSIKSGEGTNAEVFNNLEPSAAYGEASHAEGIETRATGYASHAEGYHSEANRAGAHAGGEYCNALTKSSFVQGHHLYSWGDGGINGYNQEGGVGQAVLGKFNTIPKDRTTEPIEGEESPREEDNGEHVVLMVGCGTGDIDPDTGKPNRVNAVEVFDDGSMMHGNKCQVWGLWGANAEGNETIAGSKDYGYLDDGWGEGAHAEGQHTEAIMNGSHAEGSFTRAYGFNAHAEGRKTVAGGKVIDGQSLSYDTIRPITPVDGSPYTVSKNQHAEGEETIAYGNNSHAGGLGTIASSSEQTAIGRYNNESANALFIIGDGTKAERYNLFEVGKEDNEPYIQLGNTKVTESQLIGLLSLLR